MEKDGNIEESFSMVNMVGEKRKSTYPLFIKTTLCALQNLLMLPPCRACRRSRYQYC